MEEPSNPQKATFAAAAALMGLGAVNWVAGHTLGYPVVYCLSRPLMPLFAGLFYWLWLASMVMFVLSLFANGMKKPTFYALATVLLTALIPEWAKTLFGLGMTCDAT